MNANQKFFASKMEDSMEFLSFDNDMYADEWSANGDWNSMDGDVYATGGNDVPTSTPFILTLHNTTGAAISDITFLNAGNAIALATSNYGINAGVAVTYNIAGVSYSNFLYSLLTQSVKIGTTYLQSSSTTQLTNSLKIETYNVRGKGGYDTFTPVINPMQNQTTSVVMPNTFILNQFTKLTLSSLEAGVSVKISMYPIKEESSISGLNGRQSNNFGDPKITGLVIKK